MARDKGGPSIACQLLIYPVCDGSLSQPSYESNATGYYLTRRSMQWFWDQYVPDPTERTNPYASPLHAPDLSGMPPSLIIAAELDPLRDEAKAYAMRLSDTGGIATYVCYDGLIHGFFRLVPDAPWVRSVIGHCAQMLRIALAGPSSVPVR